MRFELTISGLCVVALKRSDANDLKPESPTAIDIIVPNAHGHICRLSYLPAEFLPTKNLSQNPDLTIDIKGGRIASLPLNEPVAFSFDVNPTTSFTAHWGPEQEQPSAPFQETWLNWIPRVEDLGFGVGTFKIGPPGTLPDNAVARITLPPGSISSRSVAVEPDTDRYIVWEFPGNNKLRRVLSNELVYTADHIDGSVSVKNKDGKTLLSGSAGDNETLQMCLSNDMIGVPPDFNSTNEVLKHLMHLDVLGFDGTFELPDTVKEVLRTGHPICMGTVFVWGP